MYYANKIHMHDQVFNQVDSIMDFYKKKPSKALLFVTVHLPSQYQAAILSGTVNSSCGKSDGAGSFLKWATTAELM